MTRFFRTTGILSLCLGLSCLNGCLPDDNRPEPAKVRIRFQGEAPFADEANLTEDGWTIDITKVLVAIESPSFGYDAQTCSIYSSVSYGRIFDGLRKEPEKLAQLYAIGKCSLSYVVASPQSDALLAAGTTEGDKTLLRTSGSALPGTLGTDGTSLLVEGHAEKGGVTKQFSWAFRRALVASNCTSPDRPTDPTPLALESGDDVTLALGIRVENLFDCGGDPMTGTACFAHLAEADDRYGDGDGTVTFDELNEVPFELPNRSQSTWFDVLYGFLMPMVVRPVEYGLCDTKEGREGGMHDD
jgi:hypothetical protein